MPLCNIPLILKKKCGSKSDLEVGPLGSFICSFNCSKSLNLSAPDLIRPLSQQVCHSCRSDSCSASNPIIQCDGCPKAIHLNCYQDKVPKEILESSTRKWYCASECKPSSKKRSIQENTSTNPKKIKSIPSTPPPDNDYNIPKFIKKGR